MNCFIKTGLSLLLLCVVMTGISSCKQKDDPAPVADKTGLKIGFSNRAGTRPLLLNTEWYVNAANDSFQVSMYKYYISNIVLKRTDGTTYTEPESYHLINQEDTGSRNFLIADVPPGHYTGITFMIGVDSLRNSSGAQTGALDQANGMFWSWNTGYIMAKMEGKTTKAAIDKNFAWHVGGVSGSSGGFNLSGSVVRTVQLSFPQDAVVATGKIPGVHIFSDALEWFKTPAVLSIADHPNVVSGRIMSDIADNYADMFHIDHVDN